MTIKIELTTETLTAPEAGALAAFLLTLHSDAVTAALGSLGEVTVSGEPFKGFGISPEDAARLGEIASRPGIQTGLTTFRTDEDGAVIESVMPAEAGAPLPDADAAPLHRAEPFVPATQSERGQPDALPIDPDAQPLTAEQAFGAITPPTPAVTGSTENVATPPAAELDAEGLPWDERIHSSNHKQSANGVWMKRRGVLPTVDAQVRAELRQTYPAPAPSLTAAQRTMQAAVSEGLIPSPPASSGAATAPVPPAPSAAVAPTSVPAPPSAPSIPTPPTASTVASEATAPSGGSTPAQAAGGESAGSGTSATTAASPSNGPAEFQRIMQKLAGPTGYQPTGKVTLEQTNGIVAAMGLTGLADLLKNPDRIPEFEAQIDALAGAA